MCSVNFLMRHIDGKYRSTTAPLVFFLNFLFMASLFVKPFQIFHGIHNKSFLTLLLGVFADVQIYDPINFYYPTKNVNFLQHLELCSNFVLHTRYVNWTHRQADVTICYQQKSFKASIWGCLVFWLEASTDRKKFWTTWHWRRPLTQLFAHIRANETSVLTVLSINNWLFKIKDNLQTLLKWNCCIV